MKGFLTLLFCGALMSCVTTPPQISSVEAKEKLQKEKPQIFERTDLAEAIGKAGCATKYQPASKQLPIEDAQVHAEHIALQKAAAGRTFKDVLKDYAMQVAIKHKDNGYGFYVCEDGSGIAFSTRAPWPFATAQQNFKDQMSQHCRDIRIGFAPDAIRQPVLGKLFPSNLNRQQGYLAIECYPRGRPNVGPQLWYMVDFNSAKETPFLAQANTSIKSWVNSIRRKLQLPSLKSISVSPTPLVDKMFASGVNHDIASLKKLHKELSANGYKVLGEARVVAKNPFSVAYLLWHSAPHRGFLLNPNATGIIQLRRAEKNIYVLLQEMK